MVPINIQDAVIQAAAIQAATLYVTECLDEMAMTTENIAFYTQEILAELAKSSVPSERGPR